LIMDAERPAFDRAVLLLQNRSHSEMELIQKLRNKGFEMDDIQKAVELLKEYHYIDDEKFAAEYIRSKKVKDSKRKIMMALYQKGVASETAEHAYNATSEETDEGNEYLAIKNSIERYLRRKSVSNAEEKNKLMAHLYQKGFLIGDIQNAVNKLDL